jgi:hypothetical protein
MPFRTTSEFSVERPPASRHTRWWLLFVVVSAVFLWFLPSYSFLLITNTGNDSAFVFTEVGEIRERVAIESQRSHFEAERQGKEGALGVVGVPGCESVYVPAGFSAFMTCQIGATADRGVRSLTRVPSLACGIVVLSLALAFWRIGRHAFRWSRRVTKSG